ncbi:MAG: peptidoglycan DD-metalloendopeptidase family protein [Deltaproteobacteria bacterium]|nr:peptidoglycan DD-metalloendopeptidase family protein [Deltaproteobacteria bacterium]
MNDIGSISAQGLTTAPNKKDTPAELKKALTEFEALFINQMLKTMRESVIKSDLFHGGSGEDIYTSLYDAELSKVMAQGGGIGLEKMMIKQLTGEFNIVDQSEAPLKETNTPGRAELSPEAHIRPDTTAAEDDNETRFPIKGRVSSNFGLRKDPFTGDAKFHHGIDIAANEGSPIYPAAGGTVIFSGVKGGYGNMVEVLHDNGVITKYGHNSKNIVKQGDRVNISDPIAYVGSTGRSTGPHVHFEVIKDGSRVNPLEVYG